MTPWHRTRPPRSPTHNVAGADGPVDAVGDLGEHPIPELDTAVGVDLRERVEVDVEDAECRRVVSLSRQHDVETVEEVLPGRQTGERVDALRRGSHPMESRAVDLAVRPTRRRGRRPCPAMMRPSLSETTGGPGEEQPGAGGAFGTLMGCP